MFIVCSEVLDKVCRLGLTEAKFGEGIDNLETVFLMPAETEVAPTFPTWLVGGAA
jgi:hypothetical protein